MELVLDRLVSVLKPGGLLLIRTGNRYTAAAPLDRPPPGPRPCGPGCARALPGRSPRFTEAVCDAGIASYMLMRGLVIAARGTDLRCR